MRRRCEDCGILIMQYNLCDLCWQKARERIILKYMPEIVRREIADAAWHRGEPTGA